MTHVQVHMLSAQWRWRWWWLAGWLALQEMQNQSKVTLTLFDGRLLRISRCPGREFLWSILIDAVGRGGAKVLMISRKLFPPPSSDHYEINARGLCEADRRIMIGTMGRLGYRPRIPVINWLLMNTLWIKLEGERKKITPGIEFGEIKFRSLSWAKKKREEGEIN